MVVFNKHAEFQAHLAAVSKAKTSIGFVPTMGALHKGHLSLLNESLLHNDITVTSIFVNPTQFINHEDLARYPRTLDSDLLKIRSVSDKIIVYAPTVDDIYKGKTISDHFDFDGLENQMEGKFRPGHFDGVATIVRRLFEIVKPTNAYFGEKDFQQLQIIRKMTIKNDLPVNIVGCPIFREINGLAMSSRNERLTKLERAEAAIIFTILKQAQTMFANKSAKQVTDWVQLAFKKVPAFQLEYFQIADEATLSPFSRKKKGKKYRAFIAVFVNQIRLIDTILLN